MEKYIKILNDLGVHLKIYSMSLDELILSNGVILTGNEIRKFKSRIKSPIASTIIDELYNITDNTVRDHYLKKEISQAASKFHTNRWINLSEEDKLIKQQHMNYMRQLVDYKSKPKIIPWNKGKTKFTDDRLLKNSIDRTGIGNPMYGTTMSTEDKLIKSELIKSRIVNGEWTPHVHNSRTHWNCSYNNKNYRSSWEVMYAYLNPSDEYETIRIPYSFEEHTKIYIVDFVNHESKTLTEIKPQVHKSDIKFNNKQRAAVAWCECNGYTYQVLSEQYFIDHYHLIDFNQVNIPNLRTKLSKIKYEANKTN